VARESLVKSALPGPTTKNIEESVELHLPSLR
jgi:hypothetical protein